MLDHHAARINTAWLVAAVILSIASSGRGEEAISARADLNGDGTPDVAELRGSDEGRALFLNGNQTEAEVGSTDFAAAGAELRPIALARGQRAGLFRAPLAREGLAFEALLLVRGRRISVVWSGITGLRGDRGTRWGERIIVEDLTGDGHDDIVVASIADEVPLCGVAHPELFPRALDPASGRLRPVILNRLRGLDGEPPSIEGTRGSPGPLGDSPSIEVATWAVASTIVGDRGVVEGLAAPRALADGDLGTSWIEGRPGPGTHEFVTARLLPGPYRVQALALTLAPRASDEDGGVELGRSRSLTLLIGGADGVQRFSIDIPEDPDGYRGEPLWVSLPEPISASCISLVLGRVHGGRRAPSATAIAEVDVFTDLDFDGGAERLVEAFAEGTADAEVLLRALGARAVPLLSARWSVLDSPVRRRATRVMADLEEPAAAELLVRAVASTDDATAREARRGLISLGDDSLDALGGLLGGDDAEHRGVAALLVGEIGSESAISLLLSRLSEAPTEDHSALRLALSAALEDADSPGRQAALEGAAEASGAVRLVLLTGLNPAAPEERETFARLVSESWEAAESFEDRYRVLTLAGGGGPVEQLRALAGQVLREEEDRYLRAHAAKALGFMEAHPSTLAHLSHAAQDDWAGARLAAARAIGHAAPEKGRATLLRLLRNDGWPVVRSAAAESLTRGPVEGSVPPLVEALADDSSMVQVTACRLLGDLGRAETLAPLLALAENGEAPVDSRQAAARAIGALCSTEARAVLLTLIQRGRERRATSEQARVAAAAIEALAFYRGEDIDALIIAAAREGVAGLRMSAIEALGHRGSDEARAALEALTEDPTPLLSAAAATSLRLLEVAPRAPSCPEE